MTVYIQYYSVLVSDVQYSGETIVDFTEGPPWYFTYTSGPVQSYYDIIDYISYAITYIPVTIL